MPSNSFSSHTRPTWAPRTTSKRAKKVFKTHGPRLSSQEARQLDRSLELDDRASKLRKADERKRANARRKAEKDEKQRQAERSGAVTVHRRVPSSQCLLEGFVRRVGVQDEERVVYKDASDTAREDDTVGSETTPRQSSGTVSKLSLTPEKEIVTQRLKRGLEESPRPTQSIHKRVKIETAEHDEATKNDTLDARELQIEADLFDVSNTQIARELRGDVTKLLPSQHPALAASVQEKRCKQERQQCRAAQFSTSTAVPLHEARVPTARAFVNRPPKPPLLAGSQRSMLRPATGNDDLLSTISTQDVALRFDACMDETNTSPRESDLNSDRDESLIEKEQASLMNATCDNFTALSSMLSTQDVAISPGDLYEPPLTLQPSQHATAPVSTAADTNVLTMLSTQDVSFSPDDLQEIARSPTGERGLSASFRPLSQTTRLQRQAEDRMLMPPPRIPYKPVRPTQGLSSLPQRKSARTAQRNVLSTLSANVGVKPPGPGSATTAPKTEATVKITWDEMRDCDFVLSSQDQRDICG